MPRALLYTLRGCALLPLNALADWEYSASAQLALFDSVEHRCRSFDPALFRREYEKMLAAFTIEERFGITAIRQSAEYREVLAEANKELEEMIAAAGKDGEAIVCKEMMEKVR